MSAESDREWVSKGYALELFIIKEASWIDLVFCTWGLGNCFVSDLFRTDGTFLSNSFIIDGCENGVTPPIASRGNFTLEIDSQVYNLSAQMMCVEGDYAAAHGVGVHAILCNNSEWKLRMESIFDPDQLCDWRRSNVESVNTSANAFLHCDDFKLRVFNFQSTKFDWSAQR